jgi:hypothetical protein
MSLLTVPFRRWLEAGCPDEFGYDGMLVDADWILTIEDESISEGGLTVLDDATCAQLDLSSGSTNADTARQ